MSYDPDIDRVMVDIETLGTEPGSVIMSIGACRFDPMTGVDRTFYVKIDVDSAVDAGLTIDPETQEWWASRDQNTPSDGDTPLSQALADFSAWMGTSWSGEIWANSPAFDCEMLGRAYEATDRPEPWDFYEERDVRTLRELPGAVSTEMEGTAHNALDDAKHQARDVVATLNALDAAMNVGEQR